MPKLYADEQALVVTRYGKRGSALVRLYLEVNAGLVTCLVTHHFAMNFVPTCCSS